MRSSRAGLLGFLLVTLFPSQLLGLDGRVIDQRSGTPVANAEVSILGLPGVVLTDEQGRFTWRPDPVPPFEVLVVLPGGRVLKPVLVETLSHAQPLLIQVTSVVEESITVVGSAPSIEATAASGTTLLTGRDIQARQPATLVQALEHTPGVAVVSEGHAAVPALRGLARGRTLILIDGARVTSERRVGPSATFLDPFTLEGLEVARGPGSVAYGSDAFGGVIYARTRRPEPGAPWRARGVIGLGAGVPQGRAGGEVSKGFPEGGVLLQAHYRTIDDYRSPAGEVFNSGARDAGVLAKAEQRIGPGILSGAWQSDFGRETERPRDNSRIVRFTYPEETSHRLTLSYDVRQVGGFHKISLNGFLGRQGLLTDQDRAATATGTRGIERADVRARDFHVRGYGERHVGRVKLEIGGESVGRSGLRAIDRNLEYTADGSLAAVRDHVSIDSARRVDTAAYAAAEAPLATALVLSGGLRLDHVTTGNRGGDFGNRQTSHDAASGFLAVTSGPRRGWSVTGQIARGFRDPLLSDRYFRGPSGRGFITGNPDLRPERSLQFDTAVRYTAPRYRLAVFGYQYRISDLIERYQTVPDTFFFRNRGRARIRGMEVELQTDVGSGWTVEIGGDLARGYAIDDNEPLDDIAPPTATAQLRRQFGRAHGAVRLTLHARDDRPGPTERETPGYVRLDANAGLPLSRQVELQITARNLLDAKYLASPDPRAVLAPGVSVLTTAVVRF